MKIYYVLGLAIVTFACGIIAGRAIFPKVQPPEAAAAANETDRSKLPSVFSKGRTTTSSGGGKKIPSGMPPDIDGASLPDLMALVDTSDPFITGRNLGAALEGLDSAQLEALFEELGEKKYASDGGALTARRTIFNYLALADPERAVALVLGHEDEAVTSGYLAIAIRSLAKADLSAAVAALEGIEKKSTQTIARNALIPAALSIDPDVAMQLLNDSDAPGSPVYWSGISHWGNNRNYSWGSDDPFNPGWFSYSSPYVTNQHIQQWAKDDPAAAETYARGLNAQQRRGAMQQIASARAQSDPEGALAWARGLDGSDGRNNAINSVLSIYAQMDPQRVSGMLGEIESVSMRNSLVSSVAASWAKEDVDGALAWLDSLSPSQGRAQAYQSAIYRVMNESPQSAATLIDRLPQNQRQQVTGTLAQRWVGADPAAAFEWIAGIENPSTMNVAFGSAFNSYAHTDRRAALAYLESTSDRTITNRENYYHTVARVWAAEDPQASLDWARGLEDEDQRRMSLSGTYQSWAANDPADVAAIADSVDDPAERESLLTAVSSSWAAANPTAMMNWFHGLGAADQLIAANNSIQNLSYQSPARAAEIFDSLIVEGDDEGGHQHHQILNSVGNITNNWAQHDPAAAAEWVGGILHDDTRIGAIDTLVNQWIQFDPVGASEWAGNLPAGQERDTAAQQIVNQMTQVDPFSAFDWAQSISDGDRSYRAIHSVVRQWVNTDLESARASVASASVTPSQREELESILAEQP